MLDDCGTSNGIKRQATRLDLTSSLSSSLYSKIVLKTTMPTFSISKRSLPRVLSSSLLFATFLTSAAAQDVTALRTCLTERSLQLIIAEDSNWEAATSPWSLRYNPEPAAIVTPDTSEDIAAALACAVESETKVAALNGGHSYGAYGLGGTYEGALIINMANFDRTSYDETTQLLT